LHSSAKWTAGYLYWGVGWLLLGFLAAELAAFYGFAPWPTLSQTVWHSTRYDYVGPLLFALLITLCVHFLYHRPLWHSVLFGLAIAAVAHWLDKRL
jgi:hypothetical protein